MNRILEATAFATILLVAAAMTGCKRSEAGSTDKASFAGVWLCDTDATVRTSTGAATIEKKAKTELTVTNSASGDGITATGVRRADGKSLGCVTKYTVSGNTMTAAPNQVCNVKMPYGNPEIEELDSTLDSAVARLSGDAYTETIRSHFTSRAKGTDMHGTVNGTTTCTRKR